MMTTTDNTQTGITKAELARLGGGDVGYIRRIGIDAAKVLLGRPVTVEGDVELFCLYLADGTPVAISDSRSAAAANASENNVMTMSVH